MSLIAGYTAATNPSLSTPGLVWQWTAGVSEAIRTVTHIPGSDYVAIELAGTNAGVWVTAHAVSGLGRQGRTIAPDPNWSVTRIVMVSDSGQLIWAEEKDIPAGTPAQKITYQPSGSPQWTAKKVR